MIRLEVDNNAQFYFKPNKDAPLHWRKNCEGKLFTLRDFKQLRGFDPLPNTDKGIIDITDMQTVVHMDARDEETKKVINFRLENTPNRDIIGVPADKATPAVKLGIVEGDYIAYKESTNSPHLCLNPRYIVRVTKINEPGDTSWCEVGPATQLFLDLKEIEKKFKRILKEDMDTPKSDASKKDEELRFYKDLIKQLTSGFLDRERFLRKTNEEQESLIRSQARTMLKIMATLKEATPDLVCDDSDIGQRLDYLIKDYNRLKAFMSIVPYG